MGNCVYRLLQMQNDNIGAVAVGAYVPFGVVNRLIERDCARSTFETTTSGANLAVINEPGFYEITYSGSIVAAAVGTLTLNLQINGVTVYTYTVTVAAAGTIPVSFKFITRAFCNYPGLPTNTPLNVQVQNATGSVAITGGTSLLQVERVSDAV